ncbi:MAG: polysaccharide deacetylase [Lachnospiraceae bacterium]|nr:polysaccharide deacetylase [Lachnospiraceae bacterium]MDD3615720.1 polysaccharide deacetylase [Lachnospiraceae bacterium]
MGNMNEEELRQRRRKRQELQRKKRLKQVMMIRTGLGIILALLLILVITLVVRGIKSGKSSGNDAEAQQTASQNEEGSNSGEGSSQSANQDILDQAAVLAAGYDYDGAISLIQSTAGYESDIAMTDAISEYETTKASCVPVDVTTVPHIFYHSLITNNDKVFDGDYKQEDYNCWYTTVSEFDKITQQMYDNGYVIVRLRDLVKETKNEDGSSTFEVNDQLMLPPNKKAVVLSVDDLSYYHFGEADGFPDKIVVDENGLPKCQMTQDDGTVEIGDFDVVPRLNTFLTEHPDGCYKGARGLIALTGYNGILGYRTDIAYKTKEKLDLDQQEWLDAHPDFNWDTDVAEATKAAEAIKNSGWEFASHTWGHARAGSRSLESLMEDNDKWMTYVSPLIGPTDTIIFAHGEDIAGSEDYSMDNGKYAYFHGQGFNFYCNVDSTQYWNQYRSDYVRQGRRDLDGYQLYKSMTVDGNLEDLFHVEDVFDPVRPTPVTLSE